MDNQNLQLPQVATTSIGGKQLINIKRKRLVPPSLLNKVLYNNLQVLYDKYKVSEKLQSAGTPEVYIIDSLISRFLDYLDPNLGDTDKNYIIHRFLIHKGSVTVLDEIEKYTNIKFSEDTTYSTKRLSLAIEKVVTHDPDGLEDTLDLTVGSLLYYEDYLLTIRDLFITWEVDARDTISPPTIQPVNVINLIEWSKL